MNNKHSGLIGNLTVASDKPYIFYDKVHGLVSEHRQLRAAQQTAERDGQTVPSCRVATATRTHWSTAGTMRTAGVST